MSILRQATDAFVNLVAGLGVLLIGGASFIVAPIASDAFQNQVTIYPIIKGPDGSFSPLNRSVYKVFPETQTVVTWLVDGDVPETLGTCSVRNRLHWRCERKYPDGSVTRIMSGGQLETWANGQLSETGAMYVSRLEWWLSRLKGWLAYSG